MEFELKFKLNGKMKILFWINKIRYELYIRDGISGIKFTLYIPNMFQVMFAMPGIKCQGSFQVKFFFAFRMKIASVKFIFRNAP